MDAEPWLPRSLRAAQPAEVDKHLGPHEGVPSWMRPSIEAWIDKVVRDRYRPDEFLLWLQRTLRGRLDGSSSVRTQIAQAAPDLLLDVVDSMVRYLFDHLRDNAAEYIVELHRLLADAGSVWQVGHVGTNSLGKPCLGLIRRVDPTVHEAASEAMRHGEAGRHLAEGWAAIYGRETNASHAYAEAVKAVEAAAFPVVAPNHPTATFGTMIRNMRDAPHKWECALTSPDGHDPMQLVIDMCSALWKGHTDRHGNTAGNPNFRPDPKKAEAAVHLAVNLVHWFSAGVITRRT